MTKKRQLALIEEALSLIRVTQDNSYTVDAVALIADVVKSLVEEKRDD